MPVFGTSFVTTYVDWGNFGPQHDPKRDRRFKSPIEIPQSTYQKHCGMSSIGFGATVVVLCQFLLPVL